MKFIELVSKRQSVRKYQDKEVDPHALNRCLEAARLAPSASNSQPWSFVVVNEQGLRSQLARLTYDKVLTFNKFVDQAPVLVVFVVEKPKVITRIGARIKSLDYPLIDIGIAAEHFCLQAAEEELGTCMLGWFQAKPIKKLLNIPASKTIGLIVTLGHPPEEYRLREKTRKKLKEITFFNGYKK